MSLVPGIRESLLAAKKRLQEQRAMIRQQHDSGSPGIQVCARLTDLVDSIVLELWESALAELGPAGHGLKDQVALIAHGGYGRRDVAPFSDVDLMIIHEAANEEQIEPLAKTLLRDIFDVGLNLGQSVRTPAEACVLALQDATICTTLMESRYLGGSERLYESFSTRFQRQVQNNFKSLLKEIEKARRDERSQYGESVYMLEPNVKRSRGGLRDIQLLRWIGFAAYGSTNPETLQMRGLLSKEDRRTIRDASEFLLRLRSELHFSSNKSQDVLLRTEQVRLATLYGYKDAGPLLAVEQFMREYFRHTMAVRSIVARFLDNARPGSKFDAVLGVLFGRQLEGDYRVTPRHIAATSRGLEKLRQDPNEVLRLADLANLYDKRIDHATWEAVREAAPGLSSELAPETAKRFVSLMSQPGRLSELLHRLHELGVLEKIIPDFTHARCLLQFNEYHKFTVDEHCLLAVQRATEFGADKGPIGTLYRRIKQKRTLHLALLIHDLGKGYVEDHSEVGLRIAADTAERLRLPLLEGETLKFLVHKHLLMAHLAFRRDTSDDQLIVKFAVEVGSPEMLDMLTVLTASDFAAVGPGVWNNWKGEVLADLHRRTLRHLTGEAAGASTAEYHNQRRAKVREALGTTDDQPWYDRQLAALPSAYLHGAAPARIATDLIGLQKLQPGEVQAVGRYLPESHTVEYTIGTQEQIAPGVFHRLTGALASQGLQILSAEINTLADGLILDRFYVVDPDYADEPPPDRLQQVQQALVDSLRTPRGESPAFRKVWSSQSAQERTTLNQLPTRVIIDNSTSDRMTILDIFARDRMGLLYTITRALFQLGLSVSVAKIGTYLDQVVDVFYVTDQQGNKIQDEERLQRIRTQLLQAIDQQ